MYSTMASLTRIYFVIEEMYLVHHRAYKDYTYCKSALLAMGTLAPSASPVMWFGSVPILMRDYEDLSTFGRRVRNTNIIALTPTHRDHSKTV